VERLHRNCCCTGNRKYRCCSHYGMYRVPFARQIWVVTGRSRFHRLSGNGWIVDSHRSKRTNTWYSPVICLGCIGEVRCEYSVSICWKEKVPHTILGTRNEFWRSSLGLVKSVKSSWLSIRQTLRLMESLFWSLEKSWRLRTGKEARGLVYQWVSYVFRFEISTALVPVKKLSDFTSLCERTVISNCKR
jgi:hypothetical protein